MYAHQWPIKNILLIDDDEDDFFFFREAVQSISTEISVSYVNDHQADPSNLEELHPDIIFLDINMPKKNGFDYLRQIKQSPYRDVPVIIYSTTRNQSFIKEAYETGAHLFFTKPFSFDTLVKALKDIFSLNWNEPAKITSTYFSNGHYQPFTA
jgi:CheY-like chemotaxis protein